MKCRSSINLSPLNSICWWIHLNLTLTFGVHLTHTMPQVFWNRHLPSFKYVHMHPELLGCVQCEKDGLSHHTDRILRHAWHLQKWHSVFIINSYYQCHHGMRMRQEFRAACLQQSNTVLTV
jgi:hypothetical protein